LLLDQTTFAFNNNQSIKFVHSQQSGCCGLLLHEFLSRSRDDHCYRLAISPSSLTLQIRRSPIFDYMYLPNDCILFVELWQSRIGDKKLTVICVWPAICHGNYSSSVMLQTLHNLIIEIFTVHTFSSLSRPCRISSLNYKPWISYILPLMFRWKIVWSYFPIAARARKFLDVLGHNSQNNSILIFPWVVWKVIDILSNYKLFYQPQNKQPKYSKAQVYTAWIIIFTNTFFSNNLISVWYSFFSQS